MVRVRAFAESCGLPQLSGKPPFRRLVYPVGSQAHLGVHVTVDLAGLASILRVEFHDGKLECIDRATLRAARRLLNAP